MTIIFDLVILLWKPSQRTILNIAKTLYIIIIVYSVLDTLLNVLNALLFNGYTKAYDIWLFFSILQIILLCQRGDIAMPKHTHFVSSETRIPIQDIWT